MSETIDKALDTVKAVTTEPVVKAVNQRLSNPFFLCFISSWVLCNWDRVLLLLFSFSLDVEQRIEKIKALPSNSVFFGISIPHTHTFWYPFFASIIFVVGTPFISYFVDVLQNWAFEKKSSNDSNRKLLAVDLKIKEINKNVEYKYAESIAELNAENENKSIKFSTIALEDKYADLELRIKDLNVLIKEKEKEVEAQNNSYKKISDSLLLLRDELDSKGKELLDLNSKIISNQNKLDGINQEILRNTLPFTNNTMGTLAMAGLGGLGTTGFNMQSKEVNEPNLASKMLDKVVLDIEKAKAIKSMDADSINENNNDNK